jgi:TrmH family RNA methyltransferase
MCMLHSEGQSSNEYKCVRICIHYTPPGALSRLCSVLTIVLEYSGSLPYNTGMIVPLDNISIVLVDTKTPANVGAVARGMMNMGLSRLVLVDPPEDAKGDARRLAAGAEEILDRALICRKLREAVADQGLVIGASRHRGRRRRNVHTPRELAQRAVPLLDRNRISLVFGNEVNGLDNSDLALCQELVLIPSSRTFPSLNLSHAVMIVMYEFFVAQPDADAAPAPELAPVEALEHFYGHLRELLATTGFIDHVSEERMMFSLRQLFGRARLDAREVRMLRGVLSAARGEALKAEHGDKISEK